MLKEQERLEAERKLQELKPMSEKLPVISLFSSSISPVA